MGDANLVAYWRFDDPEDRGIIKKYDEAKLRVGVEFAAPFGLLSIKHSNLEMEDGGEARSKMLLAKYERQKKGK